MARQYRTQGRRYWFSKSGARYVAEDVVLRGGRLQPQHATWDHVKGVVNWIAHKEGGVCEPFDGPADVWLELVEGAWDGPRTGLR